MRPTLPRLAGIYISNRVSDKVTAVDERLFVCRSGSAADTQAVSDYVTYFLDQHKMEYGKAPKVETAANLFRELCYNNKNALMAGIIVAGWDEAKGGQVFSVPIGGALLERPYAIGGVHRSARSGGRRKTWMGARFWVWGDRAMGKGRSMWHLRIPPRSRGRSVAAQPCWSLTCPVAAQHHADLSRGRHGLRARFNAGSGSTYIYGLCDAYFQPNMTAAQCQEFVAKALSHAMARDGSSGGVIRMVKIDEAGAERMFIPGNKLPFGPL